ncbi:MAG TPA: M15 family metallopeptidase [Bryobacteraceae bacterium]|jgi:dihydroorotase/N-acyl-D-amino-acid deacylase
MYKLLLVLISSAAFAQTYDLIISGGRIIDGSGNAWFYGDVAVKGDRIARITPAGLLKDAVTKQRIDAKGMVVSPGFIDIQGHSREPFLTGDGRVISKVTQGITTEIMGEGWTNAPANEDTMKMGESKPGVDAFPGERGFDQWLRAMQAHGASINFGSFIGSATLRGFAKGMAQGEATPQELEVMKSAVRNAMEDGAFGIASALIYPPNNYSSTHELIETSKAMAPYGGVYITHMRSEADRLLEAIDETIQIGKEAGVPAEIYHLKVAGVRNLPKMRLAIAKINEARAEGIDIGADMYPYTAGGTGLTACLPPWSEADGKLFTNLADPAIRAKIKAEMLRGDVPWENLCNLATPEGVMIVTTANPQNSAFAGKRLSEIAKAENKPWTDAAMDLILTEHNRVETLYFIASEDNLKLQMAQPWIKFGTDAAGLDPANSKELAHPRSYGNFTRIMGKYVRDEKVMPLEDAVRKASSAVAHRLSIADRGELREGAYADIVIFDANTIADRATYEKPHQISAGIEYVFVNGVLVVHDGVHTGAKPGQIVRGPGYVPRPPVETGDFLEPSLVELIKLDPTIKLDIRYATANNFVGQPFYKEARAFLQRPAAEALERAGKKLREQGFGLLIHDGYRPWRVTKAFWDATPQEKHIFVANPASGSRHNRGCAVDLAMYDLKSGLAVEFPSGYDEMSERAFPEYAGGTPTQTKNREILRKAMESEGFTVYEHEWWHFDYKDWKRYRILDIPFDQIH